MTQSVETRSFDPAEIFADRENESDPQLGATYSVDLEDIAKDIGGVGGLEFRPCVLIGLGGSGIYSVRRANRMIYDRVRDIPTIRYLYVDADTASFGSRPGLASVKSEDERCFIGGRQIQPVISFPKQNDWLLAQVPKMDPAFYQPLLRGDGCGQIRAVGRIALLGSLQRVMPAFQKAISEVTAIAQAHRTRLAAANQEVTVSNQLEIYIVASLAGGAGSGTFLDMTLLAHHLSRLAGATAKIIGIFILPEAFEQKVRSDQQQLTRMRANAYASLKEIQAFMDPRSDRVRLQVQIDAAGTTLELPADRRLFDICYLLDYKNQLGQRLSKTEDVFELVARLLLHENGTPVRGYLNMVNRNLGVLQRIAGCPITNLPRTFSTFSCTALRYPVEQIVRYCTWSSVLDLIDGTLLAGPASLDRQRSEVDTFLNTHQLNEFGSNDQVIHRLLTDSRINQVITGAAEGLRSNFGARLSHADFSRQARAKLTSFEQERAPEIAQIVQGNLAYYLGHPGTEGLPIATWLDALLASCLQRLGCRGTQTVWDNLVSALDRLKGEMNAENRAWRESERKGLEGTFSDALDALQRMSFLRRLATKDDDRLKARAIDAFNSIVDGDLKTIARAAATRVFAEASEAAQSRALRLAAFATEAGRLTRELRGQLNGLLAEAHREVKNFVVEMDVTDAAHLNAYYSEHKVEPTSVLQEFVAKEGDRFYLRILDFSYRDLGNLFARRIRDLYLPALKQTRVVDIVAKGERTKGKLGVKLNQLFEMCHPFWSSTLPQANMTYDEVGALGCMPDTSAQGAAPQFPPELKRWASTLTQTEPTLLATTTPYEILLVRYTHGARAWYLNDISEWKRSYDESTRTGLYPLHVDANLEQLPDPIPDPEVIKKQAFALGLSLGFIAKRGDDYYLNVDHVDGDINAVDSRFAVPHDTEWHTVFGSPTSRVLPAADPAIAPIDLRFDGKRPKKSHHLGLGRAKARRAFLDAEDKASLVLAAVRQYLAMVSSAEARRQLSAYVEHLRDHPGKAEAMRKQLAEDCILIEQYLERLD